MLLVLDKMPLALVALLAAAASSAGQDCVCDVSVPSCQPLPPPSNNTDGDDACVKIPRNDCPCCLVCAGQLGQPCSGSNAPCDVTNHLVCDQDTARCKKGKTKNPLPSNKRNLSLVYGHDSRSRCWRLTLGMDLKSICRTYWPLLLPGEWIYQNYGSF